ncbi:MAG: glycosyltransferase family 4 protein [Chloroflexi bacterium]|nr:glycosyltransferase family 4 protein [Chloroflexota bacterium]
MKGPELRVAIASRAVYPYHGFGGLEKHVYYLATHLKRLGVDVHLFASLPAFPAPENEDTAAAYSRLAGIPVYLTPYTYLPLRANSVPDRVSNYPVFAILQGRQVCSFAGSAGVDIIHAHGLSAFGCAWQKRRAGLRIPLVSNPHGLEDFKVRDIRRRLAYSYFRALYRYGSRLADRVIATDRSMVREVIEHLGVSRSQVVTLPNAIDIDDCLRFVDHGATQAVSERYNLQERWPIFVSAGRLEANKGFQVAIEAFAKLGDRLPINWQWIIVGEGSQRMELVRRAASAGIAGHIIFGGRASDRELHSLMELAHVFLHPTLYEGSSIVTLEAMAHCLPVIASRVGGIPDKVAEGVSGYLASPGNAEELAAKIDICLSRPLSLRQLGEEGHTRVRKDFAWPEVAQRTVDEYRILLEAVQCN